MTERYDGIERRDVRWHLRKEMNLGHLLTTITLLGTVVVTWSQFNTRVALVEDRLIRQEAIDRAQDVSAREAYARTDTRLQTIDIKLDKLIEWQINRKPVQ